MKSTLQLEIEQRVRSEAGDRCGYCLSPQHLVFGKLEIDHLVPVSRGGSDDEENLWLACRMCNNFKASQICGVDPETKQIVPLFNPRQLRWSDHFGWSADGKMMMGLTECGRATVIALQLNNLVATTVRSFWVQAGWHPPTSH